MSGKEKRGTWEHLIKLKIAVAHFSGPQVLRIKDSGAAKKYFQPG